jgi:hypothetical protein
MLEMSPVKTYGTNWAREKRRQALEQGYSMITSADLWDNASAAICAVCMWLLSFGHRCGYQRVIVAVPSRKAVKIMNRMFSNDERYWPQLRRLRTLSVQFQLLLRVILIEPEGHPVDGETVFEGCLRDRDFPPRGSDWWVDPAVQPPQLRPDHVPDGAGAPDRAVLAQQMLMGSRTEVPGQTVTFIACDALNAELAWSMC